MEIKINLIFCLIMMMVFIKTIIGFHFPWEECSCCGKKWRDINKQKIEEE